jgi:hypothetical protein
MQAPPAKRQNFRRGKREKQIKDVRDFSAALFSPCLPFFCIASFVFCFAGEELLQSHEDSAALVDRFALWCVLLLLSVLRICVGCCLVRCACVSFVLDAPLLPPPCLFPLSYLELRGQKGEAGNTPTREYGDHVGGGGINDS